MRRHLTAEQCAGRTQGGRRHRRRNGRSQMRGSIMLVMVLGLGAMAASAQNAPPMSRVPAPAARTVSPQPQALAIDWQAQYRKEVEKNQGLRGENDGLR